MSFAGLALITTALEQLCPLWFLPAHFFLSFFLSGTATSYTSCFSETLLRWSCSFFDVFLPVLTCRGREIFLCLKGTLLIRFIEYTFKISTPYGSLIWQWSSSREQSGSFLLRKWVCARTVQSFSVCSCQPFHSSDSGWLTVGSNSWAV